MKNRYLVIPIVLLFVAMIVFSALPAPVTAGPPPQPSPPVGQITFYGPDAADVLNQGTGFAKQCSCYIYEGRLSTTPNEQSLLVLTYTAGGQ